MVESILLAVTQVTTLDNGGQTLTNATGFFYERETDLFLVTDRHVILDEQAGHHPQSLLIDVHVDSNNIAATSGFSVPLYDGEKPMWRQVRDEGGLVDIAAIKLDRNALPHTLVCHAFTPAHLVQPRDHIEVGTSVLIVGFPLGFHDCLHHLPVARQAIIASAFGMRFQGNGYFVTDGRLHRGTSGAPVVAAVPQSHGKVGPLPWVLLGVHSSRLDSGVADLAQDDRLGLNCAWYADALGPMTASE